MSNAPQVEEVGPVDAQALIESGAFLLDVREPDEWEAGHAAVAHHIPLGDLEARVGELPKDQTILCVCRGGGRSGRAAEALGAVGFTSINLAGGMTAWAANGLPVVADDGPGEVI